jgi:hypothetical protein
MSVIASQLILQSECAYIYTYVYTVMVLLLSITLSQAVTLRMPLASSVKVTSTFGSPFLALSTPVLRSTKHE